MISSATRMTLYRSSLGLASRQHPVHPFVRLFMGFKTVNAFASPAVSQRTMHLNRQGLQLHAALERVRRSRAAPDYLVDPFLDVDKRSFHWEKP